MQSSNHIGKIVRKHAKAIEDGKAPTRKRRSRKTGLAAFKSVPLHRAFVAMITIWSGLLIALITAVLPDQTIAQAISLTGVFLPLMAARLILAIAFGLAGALLGFIIASALANRARMNDNNKDGALIAAFKSRDVEPIDPACDLGSESLDAPIESTDFDQFPAPDEAKDPVSEQEPASQPAICEQEELETAEIGELARRGFEMEEAPHDLAEALSEALSEDLPEDLPDHLEPDELVDNDAPTTQEGFASLTAERIVPRREKPVSLDLNEFASVPGRNAVWVETPLAAQPEPENEPVRESAAAQEVTNSEPATPKTGLEKLRQTRPEDLSLVEMVERFAAALHERQSDERTRLAQGEITREAALAEALKALSLFTEAGFDQDTSAQHIDSQVQQTQHELRGALARLQDLKGAA